MLFDAQFEKMICSCEHKLQLHLPSIASIYARSDLSKKYDNAHLTLYQQNILIKPRK